MRQLSHGVFTQEIFEIARLSLSFTWSRLEEALHSACTFFSLHFLFIVLNISSQGLLMRNSNSTANIGFPPTFEVLKLFFYTKRHLKQWCTALLSFYTKHQRPYVRSKWIELLRCAFLLVCVCYLIIRIGFNKNEIELTSRNWTNPSSPSSETHA